MTMPHQCRCAICGEIGTIVPGLPNVFAPAPALPVIQPVQPDTSASAQSFTEAMNQLDVMTKPAVCTHGYTRCMPCKFPHPDPFTQSPRHETS